MSLSTVQSTFPSFDDLLLDCAKRLRLQAVCSKPFNWIVFGSLAFFLTELGVCYFSFTCT